MYQCSQFGTWGRSSVLKETVPSSGKSKKSLQTRFFLEIYKQRTTLNKSAWLMLQRQQLQSFRNSKLIGPGMDLVQQVAELRMAQEPEEHSGQQSSPTTRPEEVWREYLGHHQTSVELDNLLFKIYLLEQDILKTHKCWKHILNI